MFKQGDKVVLINKIDDITYNYINFDTIYEVTDVFYEHIKIYVDDITSFWYSIENFISVLEYRKLKIKKVCSKINMISK